ncbi:MULTISPECIES: flagellin N-terminal helical domain-containing protein [unclassified Methylobacterium]|jgi:flagellin|uniref:flagellin N-terminal helical domain-containing protein n=1 Tax=unclassified Methylobacterium TaxID=2615210 RepID=UPI0013532A24|nr:flagellin [Methylobacterium sp. 2A]MWV25115.1 flagellin [Methylobacterium sp. 2A]
MTSLLTNTAAQTALTTLKLTNQSLEQSSNRISTGQKVATAADNAAYWSIATTIRADNGSLGAVKDAIGLGLATVNAAVSGLDAVKNSFLEIKNRLTAALNPNVERGKLQTEINARLTDLRTIASSAATNGENWLTVDSGSGNYTAERKIVASFSRVQGQIAVGTVTVNVDETKLYDAAAAGGTAYADAAGASGGSGSAIETRDKAQQDYLSAQATFNGSSKDATAVKAWSDAQDAWANAQKTFATAVSNANADLIKNATGAGASGSTASDGTGGILNKKYAVVGADENGYDRGYSLSVDNIDISAIQNQDLSKLRAYVNLAEKVLTNITNVATKLGAVQNQIQTQSNFVDGLIKGNEKSIGILVDADMEDESTKLKALQVQQQLGVQSLSIANQSTQQILSLFRG